MAETLPTTLFTSLSEFLAAQMGLHFPPNRWVDLERGMRLAATAFGFDDPRACIEWLLSSSPTKRQIETLASQLTVGETHFFRERQAFEALEAHVLPELIESHAADRRLRLWSAGCATGEEPYSLAILLARMIPNLAEWNVSILATDINPRVLQKAASGLYTKWSFRDCPAEIAETYFNKTGDGQLEIVPEIRKMVAFSYLNLVEDLYPSLVNETNALDLIFCRNVLMYFSLEQAKRVIQRFSRSLRDGSWLVVSAAEASHILFSQFQTVNFPGAILYRKESGPALEWPRIPKFENFSPLPMAFSDGAGQVSIVDTPLLAENTQTRAAIPALEEQPPSDPLVLYQEGQYSEAAAAEAGSDLLSEKPRDVHAMALQARILANQGDLEQALDSCDGAIAAERLDPALHYLRATILQEQGAMEEAANSLKRALYLDQRFVLAHFALGNLCRLRGKPQEAEKHFQNVLTLLKEYNLDQTLPESEGMTAGRLREISERLTMVN